MHRAAYHFINALGIKSLSRKQKQKQGAEDDEVDEIGQIADIYHAWRNQGGNYEDRPGLCRSATMEASRRR